MQSSHRYTFTDPATCASILLVTLIWFHNSWMTLTCCFERRNEAYVYLSLRSTQIFTVPSRSGSAPVGVRGGELRLKPTYYYIHANSFVCTGGAPVGVRGGESRLKPTYYYIHANSFVCTGGAPVGGRGEESRLKPTYF
jgi:hypothetical protein